MKKQEFMESRSKECPVYQVFDLLGRKRVIFIMKLLGEGLTGFNAIKQRLNNISAKILSDRLDDLIAAGLVTRDVTNRKPIQITYKLTPKGESLKKHIEALSQWSNERK